MRRYLNEKFVFCYMILLMENTSRFGIPTYKKRKLNAKSFESNQPYTLCFSHAIMKIHFAFILRPLNIVLTLFGNKYKKTIYINLWFCQQRAKLLQGGKVKDQQKNKLGHNEQMIKTSKILRADIQLIHSPEPESNTLTRNTIHRPSTLPVNH